MFYLIPKTEQSLPTDFTEVCNRAQISIKISENLRDVVVYASDDSRTTVIAIDATRLAASVKLVHELFDKLPTVIMNIPSLGYSFSWNSSAARLNRIMFEDFVDMYKRSGHTINRVEPSSEDKLGDALLSDLNVASLAISSGSSNLPSQNGAAHEEENLFQDS